MMMDFSYRIESKQIFGIILNRNLQTLSLIDITLMQIILSRLEKPWKWDICQLFTEENSRKLEYR